jgi:hypothetical protein
MSKTDKTRPYWVQLTDKLKDVKVHIHHYCYTRECNVGIWMPRPRQGPSGSLNNLFDYCHVWPRYQDNDKIYGRRPTGKSRRMDSKDGRARADLRRLRHKWLTAAEVDDIDSTENLPTQRWLWAHWYWD